MNINFVKIEEGTFLRLPTASFKYNYHYDKGWIPVDELNGDEVYRLPYGMTLIYDGRDPETLAELHTFIEKLVPLEEDGTYTVYYHNLHNIFIIR